MIEITNDTIEKINVLLADVPKGAETVFSNAINRGLSRIKTQALKRVKKVYTADSEALTAATTTRVNKASKGNLAGYVSFSGVKLPLYKFNVSPRKPATGQQVTAAVKKGGSGTPFEDAFIAEMSNGHIGVFERTGVQGIEARVEKWKKNKHSEKIEEKMGLSAAQMIENENIIEGLEREAQEIVNKRLIHEMNRILNGYGG